MTRVAHSVEIGRPPEAVFDFVADARNDPAWCPRVETCVQTAGEGPAAGARYETRHRPTKLAPTLTRTIDLIRLERPRLVVWRQEDRNGVFHITYRLDATPTGTRFTQSDEIEWNYPAIAAPLLRRLPSRNIEQQLEVLKTVLESGT